MLAEKVFETMLERSPDIVLQYIDELQNQIENLESSLKEATDLLDGNGDLDTLRRERIEALEISIRAIKENAELWHDKYIQVGEKLTVVIKMIMGDVVIPLNDVPDVLRNELSRYNFPIKDVFNEC